MSLEDDIREQVKPLDGAARERLAAVLRLVADFVDPPDFRRCSN